MLDDAEMHGVQGCGDDDVVSSVSGGVCGLHEWCFGRRLAWPFFLWVLHGFSTFPCTGYLHAITDVSTDFEVATLLLSYCSNRRLDGRA